MLDARYLIPQSFHYSTTGIFNFATWIKLAMRCFIAAIENNGIVICTSLPFWKWNELKKEDFSLFPSDFDFVSTYTIVIN